VISHPQALHRPYRGARSSDAHWRISARLLQAPEKPHQFEAQHSAQLVSLLWKTQGHRFSVDAESGEDVFGEVMPRFSHPTVKPPTNTSPDRTK
jgi:hypothetical protein